MIDSCGVKTNNFITIAQALEKIKETIIPINDSERITLKNALGRILYKSVYSPINIPPDRNSAMDGYAIASSEIKPMQSFTLSLAGTSWAGKPYKEKVNLGECIRIFTGAVVPDGADSVIMQEKITKNKNKISFPPDTKAQQNIRKAGVDININNELLTAPKKISAVNIGLLASAGIYDIPVQRKQNIAFFSTGDELSSIGQNLRQGQIYDSNRYALNALLSDNNCHIHDLGVVADNQQQLKNKLLLAADNHDVIITTGGASVGDADYIKEVLDDCGDVGFWKIAIKPGKPLAFGKIKDCYFFGLPGNPVSVITTFHKIVRPALHYLSGIPEIKTLSITAVSTDCLKKDHGRQEYQRGILSQNDKGEFFVKSAGKQGSNIMSAMSKANCYIVLPIECNGVSKGEKVIVEPFEIFV